MENSTRSEAKRTENNMRRRKSIGHKTFVFPQELTEEQIHSKSVLLCFSMTQITRSFEILDANKDGRISKSDVMKGSQLLGIKLTSEEAEAMIVAGDLDSDGFLSLQDYIQMMKERYVPIDINTARMEAAFEVIDKNKDGYISIREFKEAVMYKDNTLNDNEIEQCFNDVDKNQDGKINFKEFMESSLCSRVF